MYAVTKTLLENFMLVKTFPTCVYCMLHGMSFRRLMIMVLENSRDAPNMLKNLPIIPSRTSQNLSLLFFKIPLIIPKLFRSDSKKITAIAN